jgi:hypothetical protein
MPAPATDRDRLVGDAVDRSSRALDAERRRHLVAQAVREQLRGVVPPEHARAAADVLAPLLVSTHLVCRYVQHCPEGAR